VGSKGLQALRRCDGSQPFVVREEEEEEEEGLLTNNE